MIRRLSKRDYDIQVGQILAKMRAEARPFPDDSPQAKKKRRERAEKDKFYFFQTYLPHYFSLPPAEFHDELVSLLDMKGIPVAVAAPREHAKSTIVTLGYPLQQICFGRRHFIIIVSDTEYQATDFVRFIKLELEENERIKQDFGELKGHFGQWADDSFVTAPSPCPLPAGERNKVRGGVKVLARGKGQKIRGLRHRQYRPDLVVMDDIENDQSVRNPRQVEKALKWIVEAVYPSIDQQGSLFIIGTLLARKSVLAQLIYADDYKEWVSRVYQALTPSPLGGEGRGEGEIPLWPERHSLKSLLHKKSVMGSVSFNKEYQNDPKDDQGMFREEWMRYYHPSEIRGRQLSVFTFIDPSVGSGESADYKAIITVGQDTDAIIYVLDAYIRKASIDTLLLVTYNRYSEFHPQTIGIEDNVFQKLLIQMFDALARQRSQYLPLRGVTHTTAKESRVARLSPLVERGIVRFQKGHSDQDILIEQLIYFPSSTVNDDGPDALEGAVDLANAGPAVCLGVDADRETYQSTRPSLFGGQRQRMFG